MSHPNQTGNGCSLEDCLTNLFALTDLCGIKWRRFSSENECVEPLDDPVLIGFSRCISLDILCVWRRVQRNIDQRQPDFNSSKELWVFWYGEEPEALQQALQDLSLKVQENGTWDRDKDKDMSSGLTYECRTLLFKALHNLIDRNLLLKNFVRLGRWYVLPYDHSSRDSGVHLSFCFHYFLHGESQVCASIEVKLRPAVWRLTTQHLSMVQDNQASIQVILAPHGLSGVLTGVSYLESEPTGTTSKMYSDWAGYFPIKETPRDDNNKMPSMVEVIVGNTRMRYPSCYVLVCDNEDVHSTNSVLQPMHSTPLHHSNSRLFGRPGYPHLSPPTSPGDPLFGPSDHHGVKVGPLTAGSVDHLPSVPGAKADVLGYQIAEKVRQDACMNLNANKRLPDVNNLEEGQPQQSNVGSWNFTEPGSRVNCNCVKHRKKTPSKGTVGGKHGKGDKPDKMERQLSRHRSSVPFHRRGHQGDDLLQFDVEGMMAQSLPQANPAFLATGSTTIVNSNNTTPQGGRSTPMHDSMLPVDTPNSAPSPLDEPQPPASSTMDPTMPTLSPHPPSKTDNNRSTPGACSSSDPGHTANTATLNTVGLSNGSNINVSISNLPGSTSVGNMCSSNNSVPNANSVLTVSGIVVKDEVAAKCSVDSSGEPLFSWSSTTTKTESVSHWVHSHQQHRLTESNLKRPHLPTKGSDCDSQQPVDSLYNFDSLNSWINLPLKKCRMDANGEVVSGELLSPGSSFASHSRLGGPSLQSPSPPDPDPYEFSDEASKDPKTLTRPSREREDGMSRPSPLGIKTEDDSRPSSRQGNPDLVVKEEPVSGEQDLAQLSSPLTPGGSLTRERDLRVRGTAQDLQQIFESDSSEEDDGGALDSGVGSKSTDDQTKLTRIPNGSLGILAPVDLQRMYPTPPSHETNKSHSPETMTESMNEAILTGGPPIAYHNTVESSVPPTEQTDPITNVKVGPLQCDVFIPPPMVEAVGSSKYCPVELPSGQLSPVSSFMDYKPSWNLNMPLMDVQQAHRTPYVNLASVENISSIRTQGSQGIDASPAFVNSSQQRTPLSYELTSPASNSSSYLNKTNNSIDNHGTNSQLPEANSLLLNVLLSDSILNLFKDHNFDSCNICVCNFDINGSDVSVYLPDTSTGSTGMRISCGCAFSAAVNRRFGFDAGLFYEDEVEITGYRHRRYEEIRKPPLAQLASPKVNGDTSFHEDVTPRVLQQLLDQYASPFLSCVGSHHMNMLSMAADSSYQTTTFDLIQIRDANEVVNQALEVALDHGGFSHNRFDDHTKANCIHKWPYLRGASCVPSNQKDVITCLKSLHPILQNAIQNKRVTRLWENTYKLQGPISWKDFHELAGRGAEENHEPQPIPQFLVGHDRDWLSVSPHSLRFWDKQFLEPYGRMRDVLYVVVAPDNDLVLKHVTSFFKELSTVYEMCRLGRHCAINKPLRDGVLRVGKSAAAKLLDEPVDEWFNNVGGDANITSKLKLYAQVCKHNLAPILSDPNLDKGFFDSGSGSSHKAQFKMPEPAMGSTRPATPDNPMNMQSGNGPMNPGEEGKEGQGDANSQQQKDSQPEFSDNAEDPGSSPGIVIYLVDPFSYGPESESISRLAMIGLLRCYQQMILPEHLANNLCLQLIPLRTILEHKESASKVQVLKSIAFSVFTSARWNLSSSIMGRPLTGFGPAAAAEVILKKKAGESVKLYSPPFILSTTKSKQNQIMEAKPDLQTVLFCGYCLSEDQRWLLAVITDDKGELMEHCTINIEIPNRNQRKKASARRPGLQKLWDFILGVVSLTSHPCRLVIGRFGRMGHGELKGWAVLLKKESLQSASRRLKEMCAQCSVMGPTDVPCIISACLVSIETHPSFQVVVDAVKQEEKQSSNCPLQTPRDASVTHILVFPTSATAQVGVEVNANPLQPDAPDFSAHFDFPDDFMNDIAGDAGEMPMDIFNIFQDNNDNAFTTSPPLSPGTNINKSFSKVNGPSNSLSDGMMDPTKNDLLQQPLAMGYYISTAPPGPLPKWFWSACPENEFSNPYVFKSALHIHESFKQDDFLHKSDSRSKPHALDSQGTCDVLRYVLENYNSLSWLTFDPVLNDRRSCLPVHFVVLMQLYHALNSFV